MTCDRLSNLLLGIVMGWFGIAVGYSLDGRPMTTALVCWTIGCIIGSVVFSVTRRKP